jgi:hypothetical protein
MKLYKPTYFASAIVFLGVIIFFSIIWSTTTILPYSTANMHPYREGLDMTDNLPLEGSEGSDESSGSTDTSASAPTPTTSDDDTEMNDNTKPAAPAKAGKPSAPPSDSNLQKLMSNIYQQPFSSKEGMTSGISKDLLNPASPNDATSYFSLVGDSGVSVSLGSNYGSENDYVIDRFSQVTQSGQSCDPTSSGLSNSKGPLCLSNDLIQLLQTRGGNS